MDNLRTKMTSLTPFLRKHKVTVVGSGNWGSTIAKVVAENTAAHSELFEKDVQMWVYEEEVTLSKESKHYDESSDLSTKPQKLTHLINHFHENVKYLPGIPLPHNVIANPSLTDSVKDSTILIFNVPHQFIEGLCGQLRGHIVPYARGISCIKGVNVKESSISLFSETIGHELDIYCGALSGANIANEVAQEKFSETTIAYDPPPMDSQNPTPATSAGPSPSSSHADLTKLTHKDASGKKTKAKLKPMSQEYHPITANTLKALFHRRYFQVRVVSDVAGVSLGGALKNIVALAAGFVDGLKWGDNAKAAIMRIGLLEMVDFGKRFFPKTVYTGTFTEESCGVADLITTCAGGRNHRCAKLSIERGVSIEEVEARELNGQKLQGTLTTREVNQFLKSQSLEQEFPLFTAVYNILEGTVDVKDLPALIEPSSNSKLVKDSEETLSSIQPNVDPADKQSHAARPPLAGTTICESPSNQPLAPPPRSAASGSSIPESSSSPSLPMPKAASSTILLPPHPLLSSRYHRQLLLPSISISGQTLISQSKVLIIGLGGLGSPASLYLAALGVHTLGLVDGDTVELTNLHRQIVHKESTVGQSKVTSAMRTLRELNSEIRLVKFEERFGAGNAKRIVADWAEKDEGGPNDGGRGGEGWDIILDCTDNPATRYLISDACVLSGKVLVSGAAQRTEGQLMVLNYPPRKTPLKEPHDQEEKKKKKKKEKDDDLTEQGMKQQQSDIAEREKGPCYRCVFPVPPAPETVQSCAEVGVLGPVVGLVGVLMAMEAVKIILLPTPTTAAAAAAGGVPAAGWKPSLLLYSAMSADPRSVFRAVGLRGRRKDCVACGDEDVLRDKGKLGEKVTWDGLADGRVDYEEFCGRVQDVRVLGPEHRVPAGQFIEAMMEREEARDAVGELGPRARPLVVDVREEVEFALGSKVKGSVNVPISRILRQRSAGPDAAGGDDEEIERLFGAGEATNKHPIYFVCQRGNDSQVAAERFLDRLGRNRWVGDVKGGFVALERHASA